MRKKFLGINSQYFHRIEKMHKVGLINKWLVDSLPKKDQCWTNTQLEVTNHKVNLNDMQGSFIVLLLGKYSHTNMVQYINLFSSFVCFRCIFIIGIVCV